MQVLFIQGAGAGAHDDWDAKLVASLSGALGTDVRYPRMPDEADPKYAAWKPALLRALSALDDGAILVGHSVGGTMLLHALASGPPPFTPGALVLLAAPFIGEDGWPSDELPALTSFALPAAMPVLLYHGTDDTTVPPRHLQRYARALPRAALHVLPGRDHQLDNDLAIVAADLLPLTKR